MSTKLIRDPSLSEDEKIIMALFRSLPPEGKQEFFNVMHRCSGLNTEQFIDERQNQQEMESQMPEYEFVEPISSCIDEM